MKKCTAKLKSISPLSFSKYYDVEKKNKESHKDYEERTWKERLHYDEEDNIFIPAMGFKWCVEEAAKYLSISIPGQGKAKYTKHFKSGILVLYGRVMLEGVAKKDDIKGEWFFVPSDGRHGGGSRVHKCFPVIPEWEASVEFTILDDIITEDIFIKVLQEAGSLIGVGRFRPQNGGFYGRYSVESHKWEEDLD